MNKKIIFILTAFAFLFSAALAQATNGRVAYIVEDSTVNSAKHQILYNILNELNLDYTTIKDSQIRTTDFSQYSLLIVADDADNANYLPLSEKNSIFFHRGVAAQVWSFQNSGESTTKKDIKAYNVSSFVFDDISLPSTNLVNIYSGLGGNVQYLTPPLFQSDIKVSGMRDDGPAIFRPTVAHTLRIANGQPVKTLFYGAPEFSKWTLDGKQIFRNSLIWAIQEIDQDGDGFTFSQDCNDNNAEINPDASEIPYDDIDQNCDGVDLLDVDEDGFCEQGKLILSTQLQCPLETGIFGTDCDDSDLEANTNSEDPTLNCVNDAPLILNINYENTYSEDEEISVEVDAFDYENDNLVYSINNPNFVVNGNSLVWQTGYTDAGIYLLEVTVSDGHLSTTEEIGFAIEDVNRAPVFSNDLEDLVLDEDSSLSINLNDFASDADGDNLVFNLEQLSLNDNVDLSLDGSILHLTSSNNFNGEAGVIVLSAADGVNEPATIAIILNVAPINDAPQLISQIPEINLLEDQTFENYLNLNDYFQDVDSEMEFSVTGNSDIQISIENGIVSIIPNPDFNGIEEIIFSATDGEFTTESNLVHINVEDVREAPQFGNLNCDLDIEEDSTENTCTLTATDFENDQITFSVRDEENINCEISGDLLTYAPSQNFFGTASCVVVASDIDGEDSAILEFQVAPINDAPQLISQIPEINLLEDQTFENYLNLNDYFQDVDSEMEFSVTGNSDIQISIENGLVGFTLPQDYFGSEEIVFHTTDGEFSAESNLVAINVENVGDAPVFSDLNCQANIIEDEEYECTLSATDIENDDFIFLVKQETNLECEISGDLLAYKSKKDYFGVASCELEVKDDDGSDFRTLNVHIQNVNDAPIINSSTPHQGTIRVLQNTEKIFSIDVIDSDSQPLVSWFLNGAQEKVERNKKSSFKINKASGVYLLEAIVSDSEFTTSQFWNVIFGPSTDFTCSEVGGFTCSDSQACSGSKLDVKDTDMCCSTACIPSFKRADACKIFSPNITVNVRSPKNNAEVKIGETLKVEVDITNTLSEDDDYEIEVHLYNLDKERSEEDITSEAELESKKRKILRLDLPIPYDIEKSGSYAIYAKVEGEQCNQAYVPISLELQEDKLFSTLDLPQTLSCGDILTGKIIIENIGNNEEDASVKITNKQLGLNFNASFNIQNFGDDDDKVVKSFLIIVPEKLESGDYEIKTDLVYGTKRESLSNKIQVSCQNQQQVPEENSNQNLKETLAEETLSLSNFNNIVKGKSLQISSPNIIALVQILVVDFMLLAAILLLHAASVKRRFKREQNAQKIQEIKDKIKR